MKGYIFSFEKKKKQKPVISIMSAANKWEFYVFP